MARGKRGKKHRDGLIKGRALLWRSGSAAAAALAGKVVTISQLAAKLAVNHAEPSLQFQRSAGPVITGNWAYFDSRWGFITTQAFPFHLLSKEKEKETENKSKVKKTKQLPTRVLM